MDWHPISTAPRDGKVIDLTWMDGGEPQEIWPMRWDAGRENGLFPGKVGFWVTEGGEFTWNDDPDAGPTHWRPHRTH